MLCRLDHSTMMVTLQVYSHVTDGMDSDADGRVAALFDSHTARDAR